MVPVDRRAVAGGLPLPQDRLHPDADLHHLPRPTGLSRLHEGSVMTRALQCTRRAAIASATAASGALLLQACGSSAEESADASVHLTFLTSYANDPLKSGITALIDEWNAQNPKIHVAHEAVQFADLLTTLNVRQTGGRGADIVSSYGLWGGQLAQNGVTATPPDDVTRDLTENYSPAAVEAVTGSDGDLFGYPTEFNTYVLFYNKKLLRDAGF